MKYLRLRNNIGTFGLKCMWVLTTMLQSVGTHTNFTNLIYIVVVVTQKPDQQGVGGVGPWACGVNMDLTCVSVPPRSCPWCRQHLHFHRRSQTFSWMWQSTLMTKPVLCSRAGFLMHWKRQEIDQRETVTWRYADADTKQRGGNHEQTLEAECGWSLSNKGAKRCSNFPRQPEGTFHSERFLFETFIIMR